MSSIAMTIERVRAFNGAMTRETITTCAASISAAERFTGLIDGPFDDAAQVNRKVEREAHGLAAAALAV